MVCVKDRRCPPALGVKVILTFTLNLPFLASSFFPALLGRILIVTGPAFVGLRVTDLISAGFFRFLFRFLAFLAAVAVAEPAPACRTWRRPADGTTTTSVVTPFCTIGLPLRANTGSWP